METQEMEEVLMRKKDGNVTLYDINGSSAFCLCGENDDKKQGTKTAGTKKAKAKRSGQQRGIGERG